jgi:hypothetical protein
MRGSLVVTALKKKFRASTDNALATRLGITAQSVQNWKNRKKVTARQIAGLTHSANKAGAVHVQKNGIRPLVEFFRIDRCESAYGAKWEVLSIYDDDDREHPYRSGLRAELDGHHGVYVFFDSRGQAIYTGKARKQTLWKEINLAYNRDRGEVQKIKRVRHPEKRVQYRTSDEKVRQIGDYVVPLYELAAYFSAYHVSDEMINNLEALLVRSFANDLLNMRMEKFATKQKST